MLRLHNENNRPVFYIKIFITDSVTLNVSLITYGPKKKF